MSNETDTIEITAEETPQEVVEEPTEETSDTPESEEPSTNEETDDETDTEEEPDSDEETDDDKRNTKAEKRIATLSGKLKESNEKYQALEAENKALKEQIFSDVKELEQEIEKQGAKYATELVKNGMPLSTVVDDEEFETLMAEAEKHPDVTEKMLYQTIMQRQKYLKEVGPYLQDRQQLAVQDYEIWIKEWQQIESDLVEGMDKKTAKTVVEALTEELKKAVAKPITYKKLQRSAAFKAKWTIDTLAELGLDKQLESQNYRKNRPTLDAPTPSGKAKQSRPVGVKSPAFTREAIAKMSVEEFRKNEKAINEAIKSGQLRRN